MGLPTGKSIIWGFYQIKKTDLCRSAYVINLQLKDFALAVVRSCFVLLLVVIRIVYTLHEYLAIVNLIRHCPLEQ